MNTSEEVHKYLVSLLREKFSIHWKSDFSNAHFFGDSLQLSAREMLFLFFQLEKTFSFLFTEEDILNDNLYCPEGISKIIAHKLAR
ncbi:hypothetical protein [Halodesulfovibrio sp.]|jgi:hypothetical protein|uniref:hypothetical protein n=1 Tax=Halodesulfovibrio sp. TaxID=1912772 RepID=UPI0025F5FCBC|nr:hypothetical protein [Halodesulfovibrio sp.]MCT4625459.1 hypothetical protein [Halodesulfovibrio sp.]